jgi:hypothetical protein
MSEKYLLTPEEQNEMYLAIQRGDVFDTMEKIMTKRIDYCLEVQRKKHIKGLYWLRNASSEMMSLSSPCETEQHCALKFGAEMNRIITALVAEE